jgi:hypothetical protein
MRQVRLAVALRCRRSRGKVPSNRNEQSVSVSKEMLVRGSVGLVLVLLLALIAVACRETEQGRDTLPAATTPVPSEALRIAQQSVNKEPG